MHSYNYAIVIHRRGPDAYDPIPTNTGLDHTCVLIAFEGRDRPVLIQVSAYFDILYGVNEIRRKVRAVGE